MPPAEPCPALSNHGVIAQGELLDEIVSERRLRRGDHFLLGNIGESIADVVPHRVVKENVFLRDHGDLFAQGFDGNVADIHSVDANRPRGRFMESRQEVHQRALAGSARPHQSDHLAALRMQLNLLQHAAGVVVIGETHILEYDLVRKGRKRFCAGLFADFLLPIQVGEHLRAHTQHSLELLIDIAGSLDGHVGTEHGIQEGEELAFGHELVADLIARIEKQKRDGDGAQEIHQRSGDDRSADPAHVFTEKPARRFAELANLKILHAEGFYDAITADRFLQNLAKVAQACLTVFRGAPDFAAELVYRPSDKRQQEAATEGHSPIDPQQHGNKNDERKTFLK